MASSSPSSILNVAPSTSVTETFFFLAQTNLDCFDSNCNYGYVKDDITPDSEIELITENGEQVGSIFFADMQGSFDINFVTNVDSNLIGNTIIDITIYDRKGNSISKLPDDLKICLKEKKRKDDDDMCLSFFNTKTGEWECEDECLSRENNQYCGITDHLTSFALLLNGKTSNSNCSNEDNYLIPWMSLAFVGLAVILFMVVVIIIELKIRWQRRKLDQFFDTPRIVEES